MRGTKVKTKGHKGITLMSLVITVIVLLILAGISVQMITGENGILKKAISAKEDASEASIVEDIKRSILKLKTEGKTISKEILEKELSKDFDEVKVTINGEDKYIVEINGKMYNIENDSDVSSGYEKETVENGVISGAIEGSYLNCKIYGNTVHDEGTPSLDNPIDVRSCGDKTKNLFDLNDYKEKILIPDGNSQLFKYVDEGFIIDNTTGSSINTNWYNCKIKVKPNTTYTLSGAIEEKSNSSGTYIDIFEYEQDNNTFLKYTNVPLKSLSKSFTTTSTTNYITIRFTVKSGNYLTAKKIKIEEGDTATEYEPYGYKIPIKISSKNLFNYTDYLSGTEADEDGWFNISVDNSQGNETIYKNCWTKANLNLKPDTKYYIYVEIAEKSGDLTLHEVSDNASYSSQFASSAQDGYIKSKSNFDDSKSMLRSFVSFKAGEKGSIKFRIAVYEVKEDLFEQYVAPTTTNIYINEPLRKAGDYTDYIDLSEKKVVRKVERKRLEGPVSLYSTYDEYQGFYKNIFYNNWYTLSTNFYCNRFGRASSVVGLKTQARFSHGDASGRMYFSLPKTIATSTDEANAWLNDNETYFIYPKETPEEETLNLQEILVNKGVNILEVNTEIEPSKTEVTYYYKSK